MKSYLIDSWYRFRDAVLTPARVVPLIMTAVGAGVAFGIGVLAKHGLHLDQTATVVIVAPLVVGAVAHALHWQTGYQKYEKAVEDKNSEATAAI